MDGTDPFNRAPGGWPRPEGPFEEITNVEQTAPFPQAPPRPRRGVRVLGCLAALVALPLLVLLYGIVGLPSRSAVRALARTNPQSTALMQEREAEARRARRPVRRVQAWVPLGSVSRSLVQAVVTAEDPRFFFHRGIDWEELKASAQADWRLRTFFRGGSTITQQLAKNLFLSPRKSLVRKAREMVVARWLEEDLPKSRILEIYLNVIEWGDGIYGCQAAALHYYGKPASALSEEEAAGLAAMIPSPRRLNPERSPAAFARAQRRVLYLMAHRGDVRKNVGGIGISPEPADDDSAPSDEFPDPPAVASPSPGEAIPEELPTPSAEPSPPV